MAEIIGEGNEQGELLISYRVSGRDGGCIDMARCGDDAIMFTASPGYLIKTQVDRFVILDEKRLDALIVALQRFKYEIKKASLYEEQARLNAQKDPK